MPCLLFLTAAMIYGSVLIEVLYIDLKLALVHNIFLCKARSLSILRYDTTGTRVLGNHGAMPKRLFGADHTRHMIVLLTLNDSPTGASSVKSTIAWVIQRNGQRKTSRVHKAGIKPRIKVSHKRLRKAVPAGLS